MKPKLAVFMLIVIISITSLSLISNAVVPPKPCWTCTQSGTTCTSTCNLDICTFRECLDTPLCSPSNGCQGNGGTVDQLPPQINITQPAQGAVLANDDVTVSVRMSETVAELLYSVNGGTYRKFCQSCKNYERQFFNMGDGTQNILLKGTDRSLNVGYANITFYIDTKVPVILGISPRNGAYLNGTNDKFTLTYTETNPTAIKLYYRQVGGATTTVTLQNCPRGSEVSCSQVVDLPFPDKSNIEFYFSISDGASEIQSDFYSATIDVEKATSPLTIINPKNQWYDTKSISLEVLANTIVDQINYALDDAPFRSLCSNCAEGTKTLSVQDGGHTVTVQSVTSGQVVATALQSFSVDTKPPKIRSAFPRDGSYTDGASFLVAYQEEQAADVFLKFGVSSYTNQLESSSCPIGKGNQECTLAADLSAFEGQTISYYFEIRDHVSSSASRPQTVIVDTTAPTLIDYTPFSSYYQDKRIPVFIKVDEESTMYYLEDGKEKRLCTRCTEYNKVVTFIDGHHQLTIIAEDKAGNKMTMPADFIVDTKKPKIKSVEPRRGETNGIFTVEYDEDTLTEAIVHISNIGDYSFTSCPAGQKQSCALDVSSRIAGQTSITASVEIKDRFGDSAISRPVTYGIDQIPPEFTSFASPVSGESYSMRVPLSLTLSENSEVSYYDFVKGRETRLCTSCNTVSKTIVFRAGPQHITVHAIDKGGNEITRDITFTVS